MFANYDCGVPPIEHTVQYPSAHRFQVLVGVRVELFCAEKAADAALRSDAPAIVGESTKETKRPDKASCADIVVLVNSDSIAA